jgi:hypothetical protein
VIGHCLGYKTKVGKSKRFAYYGAPAVCAEFNGHKASIYAAKMMAKKAQLWAVEKQE